MYRILFCFCCVAISWNRLNAQNVVFSMYDNAPVYLNPAKTGDFSGNWRLSSSYRSQGYGLSEPYISSIISFEHHFYYYSQVINIGLGYIHDNSASLSFPLNEFGASIAQDVKISRTSFFRLGIQLCLDNRQFVLSGQTFPEQYDRNVGKYNSLLQLSENFPSTSTSYIKVNAGVSYLLNNSYHLNIGLAGRQLNRPVESFFNQQYKLGIQWLAHISARKDIGTDFFLKPSALYNYQLENQITMVSLNGGIYLPKNSLLLQSINGGFMLRYGLNGQMEDFGVNVGVTVNNWMFQVNHDFNLSSQKLDMAPSTAVEFSLIYIRPSTEPRVRTISNDRF